MDRNKKVVKYDFIELDDHSNLAIEIKEGNYSGVVYTYGTISVSEENVKNDTATLKFGTATLKFDTTIIKDNGPSFQLSDDFDNICGDILIDILENSFETGDYKVGSNPNNHSEESNPK